MITEVQAILASAGGMFVINIAGWVFAYSKNNHQSARLEGEETEQLQNLEARVNHLPCIENSKYMMQMGQLNQKTEDIQLRVTRMEKKLNGG